MLIVSMKNIGILRKQQAQKIASKMRSFVFRPQMPVARNDITACNMSFIINYETLLVLTHAHTGTREQLVSHILSDQRPGSQPSILHSPCCLRLSIRV